LKNGKIPIKAREANADGTIEVTIRSDVCSMEDIDAGDQVTLKILDVDKDNTSESEGGN
jgi:hypothetical protein